MVKYAMPAAQHAASTVKQTVKAITDSVKYQKGAALKLFDAGKNKANTVGKLVTGALNSFARSLNNVNDRYIGGRLNKVISPSTKQNGTNSRVSQGTGNSKTQTIKTPIVVGTAATGTLVGRKNSDLVVGGVITGLGVYTYYKVSKWVNGLVDRYFADDTSKEYKQPKPGVSGQEGAKDVPSWAKGNRPFVGENGKDFAGRLCDKKFGKGNYDKGPGSDYNKIKK